MITVVPHSKINKDKWDACIISSPNSRIYARYDYLNHLCKSWDAIIYNDYEAAMPLTGNRKYLINYLFQPFFCASLGVFGNHIDASLLRKFLLAVPSKYKYWDIYLNSGNLFPLQEFKFEIRHNYFVDINRNYNDIYNNFSKNHQRNIRKGNAGLLVKKNISIESVANLALKQSKKFSNIKVHHFQNFINLFHFWNKYYKGNTYGVFDNDRLVAGAAFLFDESRAYYLLVGNEESGRKKSASHTLINKFIEDHANTGITLDFAGSNIPSIADFYKGFGAIEESYVALKQNKLPSLLSIIGK